MQDNTTSEFNSNTQVIIRVNYNIAKLNEAFNYDSPNEIIKWERAILRDLWPKLVPEERKIYNKLLDAAKKSTAIPEDVRIDGGVSTGKVIYELELIALELMDYADKHGMLMTNKDNPKFAALK